MDKAQRGQVSMGVEIGGGLIAKVTDKAVTLYFPSTRRSFQFQWDGTGYKRQVQYIRINGKVR